MISQLPWGRERVNTIRKNRPERPQHILNYSWIDGHASWAFLPKNSPSLGKVTIFFSRSDWTPPPYVRHLRPATPLSQAVNNMEEKMNRVEIKIEFSFFTLSHCNVTWGRGLYHWSSNSYRHLVTEGHLNEDLRTPLPPPTTMWVSPDGQFPPRMGIQCPLEHLFWLTLAPLFHPLIFGCMDEEVPVMQVILGHWKKKKTLLCVCVLGVSAVHLP